MRSPRTRTRKNDTSADTDIICLPSRSSILSCRKTRPPPLQIIPELSENELDIDATHSPATARPMQFTPQQPELVSSRITLSAYTFSIDDALLMFSGDAPRSPALSASSSTSDGASSEDVCTPGTSDDEEGHDFLLPTPRLRPQRISIRPLCISKTRSLLCQDDEDIHNYFGKEEEKIITLPVTEEPEHPTEAKAVTEAAEEAEQDFYTREFEDFISLFPAIPSPTTPARRDSLILVAEALTTVIEVPEPKPRGRSRLSKPLPLLPPATPPASSFPFMPTFSLVQTTAQKSVVRQKHNMPLLPDCTPSPTPVVSRPLPRMAIPLDIENCVFPEGNADVPSREPSFIEVYVEEDANIYSEPSFTYTVSPSALPLPPAIPETPLSGMYGEVALPRSSTDSDAPRSSIDSTSSFASSTSSNTPISPFSFPSSPSSEERLRSRWSTSTLGSLAAEQPRATTILSPLRGVFSSRARRILLPPQKTPPRLTPSKPPKNKHGFFTTPSPSSTPAQHIRRQGSRSSTSSAGTSSSECDSHDGLPSGLKRKPIPLAMFLRAT
ncbi:hypothetical protein OG21DRAFT_171456 [Imleria badia]|nr:hypothetical protein OG21DRAFT_171456 [Imleria badia]